MAYSNQTVRAVDSGNGVTTSFNYSFMIPDLASMALTVIDSAGVETTVSTAGLTISGIGTTAGGSVSYLPGGSPLGTGSLFVIERRSPYTQTASFTNQDGYYPATTEEALDWLVYQTQQNNDKLARAILVSVGNELALDTLPVASVRAGYLVGFDEDGQVSLIDPASGSPVTSYWAGVLQTTNSATALAALGAPGLAIVNTFTAQQQWSKGADIASATTLVLGTDGNYFDVTGTTAITAITVAAGTPFMLQFDGVLTLTHHATNLNLPGGSNIITSAGDRAICFAEAANQVRVLDYVFAQRIAFSAYNNTLRTDVTGDNTVYTIPYDAERYDYGSGFNTSTGAFTAPRAGLYHFDAAADVSGGVAHLYCLLQIKVGGTTNRETADYGADSEFFTQLSADIELTAGAVVTVAVQVGGGTGTKVMDVPASQARNYFSGHLVKGY